MIMRPLRALRHDHPCRRVPFFLPAFLLTLTIAVAVAHLKASSWRKKRPRNHRHAAPVPSLPALRSDNVETAAMAAQDSARLDWVAPKYLAVLRNNVTLRKSFSRSVGTVRSLAHYFSSLEPFTFTNKPAWIVPNGDVHEYVSFAPYWWPTSTWAGSEDELMTSSSNTETDPAVPSPSYCTAPDTAADPRLVWMNCSYERRDGEVNPDTTRYGDSATFRNASRGAFFNAISYSLTGDERYATHMARMVRTAFLDDDTAVRPHVRFGQIVRGPRRKGSENDWSTGTFRGLIEWRDTVKLANAVVIMRNDGHCAAWTRADDDGIQKWAKQYVEWMLADPISLQIKTRKEGLNNMVSFWYSQLIALHLLLGDDSKAIAYASEYFTGPFAKLIAADGDQPYESSRTRAVHYRAFGLEAMMVNARMAAWAGDVSFWHSKTDFGTTMNDAVKFALSKAHQAKETERAELAPLVAVALSIYGDSSEGRYGRYLSDDTATSDMQHELLWCLFNSPMALTYT